MVVAETIAGLGAIKTAFDMAKGLESIHETVARDRAVIELQKEILAAQSTQAALVETVSALKARVTELETWDAEKRRYQRHEIAAGVFVFTLKPEERGSEPFYMLCPKCYHDGKPSELQATAVIRAGKRVHECPRCKTDFVIGTVAQSAPTGRVISEYNILTGKPE
jgi:hypothetical protein